MQNKKTIPPPIWKWVMFGVIVGILFGLIVRNVIIGIVLGIALGVGLKGFFKINKNK